MYCLKYTTRMNDLDSLAKTYFELNLSSEQIDSFNRYESVLRDWNQKINLTAIIDSNGVKIKHFLDSMSCTLAWKQQSVPKRIIDVGTGAGFPGVVLKILYPTIELTLVESVGKKADFCRSLCKKLQLSNVYISNERIELLAHQQNHRERYDCAVARALAPLPVLSEYLLPLIRIDGFMLAMKGAKAIEELKISEKVFEKLGGANPRSIPYLLPGESQSRSLIIVDKITSTNTQYPRSTGTPSKQPMNS